MDIGTYLNEMGSIFTDLGKNILSAIPGILLAIIILIVGYLVALLIRVIAEKIFNGIKLDYKIIKKTQMKDLIGDFKLSHFLALIIKWYVFILFFPIAADVLGLVTLSNLLMSLSVWIPNLIAAILIAIIGIMISNYVKEKIKIMNFHNAKAVSKLTQIIILVFTFLIALEQIGINISLVSNSVLIILAGIMLALGIGFGLGLRPEAEKTIKEWKKKL